MSKRPESVMVVAAHPDDIEMSCGGTIAKWVSRGTRAFYLLVTSGEKGGRRCDLSSAQLAAQREKEQIAAANVFGVEQVEFLRKEDGSLVYSTELRGEIVRWIRKWKPEAVLTHDPEVLFLPWNEVNHKDHRVVGEATLDAVYPFARGRLTYPAQLAEEGLTPHAVQGVYLWDTEKPSHWENIADFMGKRIEAVACHKSQFPKIEPVAKWLRQHAATVDKKYGMQCAEVLRYVDLRPVF